MRAERRSYRLGVDIGGTFTDVILLEDRSGHSWVGKTLTTPKDPSIGVEQAIEEILKLSGVAGEQIQGVIHGTTLVTNAIIERKGAKTALLTTERFRDILEIGRERRYDINDLFLEMPEPLVPRPFRFGVGERVLADGSVETEPNQDQVEEIANRLKAQDIEAVALCFLHSYKNPTHERAVSQWLKDHFPELYLSLSCEVSPQIREYERMSTTVANAYVQPLTERYVRRLDQKLRARGFGEHLYLMLSNGGICTLETACRFPIRLLESGPAAGALAAALFARQTEHSSTMSFDMGGTTAKLCLIDNGEVMTTREFEAARVYRFKQGSGLPVLVRAVDLIEIGAGGGSIAQVNPLGLLKVGPESAGADPGPACYANGGQDPTVTDADLVLGYLNPNFFLGGKMTLDQNAAFNAIGKLSQDLAVGVTEAAWGVHQIVNENMANAARTHAIERGKDPRSYTLTAFGGAGPVHAYRVAELLGISTLMIPPGAGATSAFGFLCAPLAFDFVRSDRSSLQKIDWQQINALLKEMETKGRTVLIDSGIREAEIRFERRCDMRYVGQSHELEVIIPNGSLSGKSVAELQQRFEAQYERHFTRTLSGTEVEVINWRLLASGPRPIPSVRHLGTAGLPWPSGQPLKGHRNAYFPEDKKYLETPVYNRYFMKPGTQIDGPAIVEENESTTVVGPQSQVTVDEGLNLMVRLNRP